MARPRKDHGLKWSERHGWTTRALVVVDGERVRRTIVLGTRDKVVARRKVKRMLEAPLSPSEVAAPLTFSDAVRDAHKRWTADKLASADQRLSLLSRYAFAELGAQRVADISPTAITEVLAAAHARGLKRQTIVHLKSAMNCVFDDVWRDRVIAENPVDRCRMPKVREVSKQRTVPTDDEQTQLLARPDGDPEIKMLVVASRTIGGMRAGDLNTLDWTAFGEAFATCLVPRRKTGQPQRLTVPVAVRPVIAAWHELSGRPTSGPVFPVTRGKRAGQAKRKGNMSYAKRLRRELKRALGVEVFDPNAGERGRWVELPRERWPQRWLELFTETDFTLPVDFHSARRA